MFYKLDSSSYLEHWGDYGDILVSGDSDYRDGFRKGPLQLYRTAPFIPSISFPGIGSIVVTDKFKILLKNSGLTGYTFKKVIKKHIVQLEWEKWDSKTEDPPIFPKSGEPEDYIEERPHDPKLAQQFGDLWELCINDGIDVKRGKDSITLLRNTWDGHDIFYARSTLIIYLSEKGKNWFVDNVSDWVNINLQDKILQ